jgi:hypothetical protein
MLGETERTTAMLSKHPTLKEYKQNNLFRPGKNVHLNACVGRNGGPYDFFAYSLGYFHAAKNLAQARNENSPLVDLQVYPLVFTFRHAVELALKDLAASLPRLWDEKDEVKLTHDLLDNWQVVRLYITRPPVFDPTDAIVPAIDRIISDLIAIDPTGQAFRFPEARNGNRFLQDTSIINIEVISEAVDTVSEAMEYWHMVASEYWDLKCDVQDELQ